MTTAKAKKEANIVEYLLYLWQMEDLLRAARFEDEVIAGFLGQQFEGEQFDEELAWFQDLAQKMKQQGLEKAGHVYEAQELITELVYLHSSLLNVFQDKEYKAALSNAKTHLDEFTKRTKGDFNNEIEPCLVAVYGLLNLRLKGKTISEETEASMKLFSLLLALLADRYKKMRSGKLQVNLN